MTDFEIAAPTRRCAATGREFNPGDKVFGVLLTDDAGKFVRKDFAADAWQGPPAGTIAYWAGRIPPSDRPRKPTFNDEHLVGLFAQLAGSADPPRMNLRYAVALLLMRRKRLKFEDLKRTPGGDIMILRDSKSGTRHEVADPRLTEIEIAAVQDEVFRQLGWE
jgi:hypothetical protein